MCYVDLKKAFDIVKLESLNSNTEDNCLRPIVFNVMMVEKITTFFSICGENL